MRRTLVLSDPHCGHIFGLRNPAYMKYKAESKVEKMCQQTWGTFLERVEKWAPYDNLFCLSDFVEGRGEKSGCTELLTSSIFGQLEIFSNVLEELRPFFKGKAPVPMELVFGTGYHTAFGGEDWEDVLANHAGTAKCFKVSPPGAHHWVNVDGVIYDLKHHVGRSATPYGQWTAPARSMVWNGLWSAKGGQPNADVLLRGHVHYHIYGGHGSKMFATCPCLSWGSKFGSRRCDEEIDWGILVFDSDKGEYEWRSELAVLDCMKPRVKILR